MCEERGVLATPTVAVTSVDGSLTYLRANEPVKDNEVLNGLNFIIL